MARIGHLNLAVHGLGQPKQATQANGQKADTIHMFLFLKKNNFLLNLNWFGLVELEFFNLEGSLIIFEKFPHFDN